MIEKPLFEELILLTAVMLGITFVRLARRLESGQRGYMLVVALVLGLALGALAEQSRFLGVVSISLGVLLVVVPWLLESLARGLFSWGKLRLAVALAGLRATLMPGAGLGRQQEILRGLALLEREGVDRALEHFRGLAEGTEDEAELTLINEQIVSMLLYGQRWDESIAHYESRFHPGYAAMRPALALGLLRAYGESGRLQRAAGLLRALEEGPIGNDPRAVGLVSQARLTFLAYTGAASTVAGALTEDGRRLLGLSAASGALYKGIAHLRAGEPEPARAELERVPTLARRSDDRAVEAARQAMTRVQGFGEAAEPAEPVELAPELRRYAQLVAERLERFIQAAPSLRRPGARVATPILVLGTIGGYLAVLGIDRGAAALLLVGGANAELLRMGGLHWARLLTGLWVQADPLATLLSVYALWLAAPLFERVFGTGRLVVTALGGGVVGLLTAAAFSTEPFVVLSGAIMMAAAVVAGTIWTLLPVRSPGFPSRARRSLLLPLVLVAIAIGVAAVPGLTGLRVSPWGLLAAAAVGVFLAMIPLQGPMTAVRWLAIPLLVAQAGAIGVVATQPFELGPVRTVTLELPGGPAAALPAVFEPVTEREPGAGATLPLQLGAVDALALQAGEVVQVLRAAADDESTAEGSTGVETNVLLQLDPSLEHELTIVEGVDLPEGLAAALEEQGVEPGGLAVFALRRDGEEVGRLVQWASRGAAWALLAAPPEALEHAPAVYAQVVAEHADSGPR